MVETAYAACTGTELRVKRPKMAARETDELRTGAKAKDEARDSMLRAYYI